MISDDAIKTIAIKQQTTELNIRREYFQHLFLSYFYQQPKTEKIFFKGGTALRILFHSPSFSEDLDFSSTLQNIKTLEGMVIETLHAIEREGIHTDIQEAKKTSGGYLAIIQCKAKGYSVAIQLEISIRQKKMIGEVSTIVSDLVPSYTLIHLLLSQLIEEKLQALLTRKKARDFYDTYFILRANLMSIEEKKFCHKC